MTTDWNWNMAEAPANTRLMVQNACADTIATFDPAWGKGRGAWFDRNNRVLGKVHCWRADVDSYLEARPKGPHVVPVL